MDKEKQRLAVAEADGWEHSFEKTEKCRIPVLVDGKEAYVNFEIPPYLHDLDVINRVIDAYVDKQPAAIRYSSNPASYFEVRFSSALEEVVGVKKKKIITVRHYGDETISLESSTYASPFEAFKLAQATASQKVEAFLKAIGKWIS